jgi:bifunctional DNA-binding transcriptional regulator/antitoxin component of YhaV-PrlF toxin-antitoxin module
MEPVTVSDQYEVNLPAEVVEALRVYPGQQLHVLALEGRIVMIPAVSSQDVRGFLEGIDTTIERDPDRV